MNFKSLTSSVRLTSCSLGLLASMACTCAVADVIAGTGSPAPFAYTLGARTATQLVGAPGGVGHALILPYFNTQNGNVTVFSITNVDRFNGKAVKVRLRGAGNGDSLLSLTILLGPGDVWNATLTRGANGIAELVTYDTTCTVPQMAPGAAQPMSTSRLTYPAWSDADKANQTREGYVEMITMADIPQTSPATALSDAIRRNGYPVASPCVESGLQAAVIRAAFVTINHVDEAFTAALGLSAPTSGLAGKWLIINAQETTTFSGSMFALRAVDVNGKAARANFVLFPQTDAAYSGAIDNVTSDPLLRSVAYARKTPDGVVSNPTSGPTLNAAMHDLPDLSTPYVVAPGPDAALMQADRLNASMSVKSIHNEYATEPGLAARTAWVISMPARRYSAAVDNRAEPVASHRLFSLVPPAGGQYFSSNDTTARAQILCSPAYFAYLDREGNRSIDYFPIPTDALEICGAASVLTFGEPELATFSVARARLSKAGPDYVNGWMGVYLDGYSLQSKGLPVLGNALIRFYNPSVSPGISGNYGITFDHWVKR